MGGMFIPWGPGELVDEIGRTGTSAKGYRLEAQVNSPFGKGKAWSETDLDPWKPLKALDSGPARELAEGAIEGAPPPPAYGVSRGSLSSTWSVDAFSETVVNGCKCAAEAGLRWVTAGGEWSSDSESGVGWFEVERPGVVIWVLASL